MNPYGRPRIPVAERFWTNVDKGAGEGGCWLWTGPLFRHGYGRVNGEHLGVMGIYRAHRVSWELTVGPVPYGLFVLHRCDNPPCVNPAHLFLGDARANALDMRAKGRGYSHPTLPRVPMKPSHPNAGERSRSRKLTSALVAEIRAALAAGEKRPGIALRFRISKNALQSIARGRTWNNLEPGSE